MDKRKNTLLFSELFKSSVEKEEENMVISSSSSSTRDSTSSGFSTPFYSDFEGSDGDFMAELTRQMAECMLQEEDEKDSFFEDSHAISSSIKEQSYVDCGKAINKLRNGVNSVPPFHQVYELKNQPLVSKEGQLCRGRRVKGAESAQQKQVQKTQQRYNRQYRGRNGSGMQAVFLGGSGSRNGPPGTGVFLPRVASDPTELKNKSGCSIVLMPTRVLQTLEVHFRQRQQHQSKVPSLIDGSFINSGPTKDESTVLNGHSQLERNKGLGNDEKMQLPQEWTY